MLIAQAILMSVLAGFSTIIGSILGLFINKPNPRYMTLALGFSAGAMILVSFMELLGGSIKIIGSWPAYLAFIAGFLIMIVVDISIPHDYFAEHNLDGPRFRDSKLARTGFFIAVGIAIHNFPEGLAMFAGTMQSLKLGMVLALAIALHNIPEGLAVSIPVFAATGSRKKAFWWSFLSGAAEPIGAILGALFLMPFLNPYMMGLVLAGVAGIMVFISIDELIPISRSYGEEHLSLVGFVFGMAMMAASLWLMGA